MWRTEGSEAYIVTLPRERARAPERKRTRNENIKVFVYVNVQAHVHVYVCSQMARPLVGFAVLPERDRENCPVERAA